MSNYSEADAFLAVCPSRGLIGRLGEKWSLLALIAIADGTHRFGALRRRLQGISGKMLTQALRALERDGLVSRSVVSTRPFAVAYQLTDLGADLVPLIRATKAWAEKNLAVIDANNQAFDTTHGNDDPS